MNRLLAHSVLILAIVALLGCADNTTESLPSVPGTQHDEVVEAPDTSPDAEESLDVAEDTIGADSREPPALDLSERLQAGEVRAGLITDESSLLSGPRAEGRLGDIKMYNSKAVFIIEAPGRAHGGYRYYGGSLIDTDVVREPGDPRSGDYFNELIMTWNLAIFEPETVEVVSDGADGAAIVKFTGQSAVFHFARSFLQEILNVEPPELTITYEYLLQPDSVFLEHRVTLENPTNQTANITWPLMLSNQGDGMTLWMRGYGFDFTDGEVEAMYYVSKHSSHAVRFGDGPANVLLDYSDVLAALEAPIIVPPNGGTITRTYQRWVGSGGSASLERELAPGADSLQEVQGIVTVPETVLARDIWVAAVRDGAAFAVAPITEAGAFEMHLPEGQYEFTAYAPGHMPSNTASISAVDGAVELTIPASVPVKVVVTDSEGTPVSARVMAVAKGNTPTPYAPASVRYALKKGWDWGGWGNVSAVGYATGGDTTIFVPKGEYEIRMTRGLSYTTASSDVDVTSGEPVTVEGTIDKVVNTDGWMSADFHIHATRSPDSDTTYGVRARQAVTDELDLPVLTEHVQIGGLQPTLDALELTGSLGVYGQEVTTFEYGHFNAFPLVEDEAATNFGAVFPYDKRPAELFEAIRNHHMGDKIIQVNHPRGGSFGAYFDVAKLDRGSATGTPELWDTNWDAIEVFNGGCNPGEEFDDWVALTNHGFGKTLAGGSDSHGENKPIGMPRTWIQVDRDAVEADREALVDPVRQRRVFVSCGPFVRFETVDGATGIGGRTTVDGDGQVSFRVEVSAPAWIQLTEVRLYRNGEVIDVMPVEASVDGVRLDAEFTDSPEKDAWYMIGVFGSGNLMPVYLSGPPNAFTNPIEVDVDGDLEWTPPALHQ